MMVAGVLLAPPLARAQAADPDIESIRRSLGDALSFATFGMIDGLGPDAQVTRDGDAYRIHLPVTGLTATSAPAVTAIARPADNGAWDVGPLTFPSTATIDSHSPAGGAVTYSLGKQDITAHIVPDMKQPTTYTARFGDIRLESESDKHRARQTIATYSVKGTLIADGEGRLAMTTTGDATDWAMTTLPEHGPGMDFLAKRLGVNASVQGLDRAKMEHLRGRLHGLVAVLPKAGKLPGPSATAPRDTLNAMLDDLTGLMTRFQVDETIEGVKISGQGMQAGAGTVIIGMHGDTADQKLDAGIDLAVNDLTVPKSVPAAYIPYVPKHISLRNRVRGLPTDEVVALLRAALAENANPVVLEAQALHLLSTPNARVSIDPFSFDAGPLAVTGTARLLASENGGFAGRIHIIASGVDATITRAQGNPAFGQIVPMLYLAKGMGKPDGASLVWDIDVDERGIRINGTPFGHPPPKR
ncbi:MAG TPA: hypothetical protein VFG62_23040 [Rhodopila sp.]|nr:hypothetical protein [Rhodopila sp.]